MILQYKKEIWWYIKFKLVFIVRKNIIIFHDLAVLIYKGSNYDKTYTLISIVHGMILQYKTELVHQKCYESYIKLLLIIIEYG